jgi:hypothetical protein
MTNLDATAADLQGLLAAGAADPFALLAGRMRLHAVFLAPFTPGFAEARRQFLSDGGGPLTAAVDQLRTQGLPPADAAATAQRIFAAAQGMAVAVLAGDHGVVAVPQPWFGHCSVEWQAGAAKALGPEHLDDLARALAELAPLAGKGFPRAIAGPAARGGVRGVWLELAAGLAESSESAPGFTGRQGDLGHWIGLAIAAIGDDGLDPEDRLHLARAHLAAGEAAAACGRIGQLDDATAVAELFDALAASTVARGGDAAAATWLAGPGREHATRLGLAYDAALAEVCLLIALGGDAAQLLPAAERLMTANRKLARQALTREAIWQVTAADPGELLDTAAAAALINRSTTFVAKRLEARTIPFHLHDGQLRLPRRALTAWLAVMEWGKLLD